MPVFSYEFLKGCSGKVLLVSESRGVWKLYPDSTVALLHEHAVIWWGVAPEEERFRLRHDNYVLVRPVEDDG